MNTIIVLSLMVNLFFLVWVFRGLRRLNQPDESEAAESRPFSVIIAAHNEEENIAPLLNVLLNQAYPPEMFQVILAADRCTDQTVSIARSFEGSFKQFEIIEISVTPSGLAPKKHALDMAITFAKYEHLLFLDADVLPTNKHLQAMSRSFGFDIAAVVSLMKFRPSAGFLARFQVFEKLLSWCVAGAGIGFQRPVISYGGNWGYTKKAFQSVYGFESIKHSLSGDDDLLLQRMGAAGIPVGMCLEPDGWIETKPPETFRRFFRQRRRHFSAGKRYLPSLQIAYFLYHASNLFLWVAALIYGPAFFVLLVKIAADMLVVRKGMFLFRERFSLTEIVVFDFCFLLYNTLIGPLGHFGNIRWR